MNSFFHIDRSMQMDNEKIDYYVKSLFGEGIVKKHTVTTLMNI